MRWIVLVLCLAAAPRVWGQPTAPNERARQARELVASGKPDQAIPIYEELVAASPGNATLHTNLAVAQFQAGRYRDVIEQCRKALELQPDLVTAWLFLGAGYLKAGEPARAIEPFEKVIEAQPGERNANLMLAEALLDLERDDEAAGRFLKASTLLPDETRVWYGLARSCDAVSLSAAQQLDSIAANSPYRQALAGDAAFALGRYAMAVHDYRRALDAEPGMRQALTSLARVYRESGHADWAKQIEQRQAQLPALDCGTVSPECSLAAGRYEDLVAASSSTPTADSLYWRAKACAALAGQAFSRLSKLPESAQLHELEASKRDEQGRYQEAVQHWRRALELDPQNDNVRKGLALSLYRGGNFEQALPILRDLLAKQPESAELNAVYGSSLLLNEEPLQAIPYLERALEGDPESPRARATLGDALLETGSYEQAIPHLEAALAIDQDGRIHYQLARAYQGAGREAQARQALEKYRQLQQAAEEQRRRLEAATEISPP